MACPPMPKHINVAMVYTESFENVLQIMRLAKEQLGEIMSACEFMDNVSTPGEGKGRERGGTFIFLVRRCI